MRKLLSRTVLLSLALAAAPAAGVAQQQNESSSPQSWPNELTGPLASVVDKMQQLGPWEEQSQWIKSAHEAMWERNGWTSEADQNARQLIGAVESIPPWRFADRLDVFCKMTTERYGLDDAQQRALRSQLNRESIRFLTRHAPTLMKNAEMFVDRRINGQSLDSQTVAEMVRNAQPVLEAMKPDMERALNEFEGTLNEEQLETFRRDRAAFDRRRQHIESNMDRWANGQWSPQEWGMDKDPLHAGTQNASNANPPPLDGAAGAPASSFETAWEMFVRDFIRRHDLDAAQQRAAWAVLNDVQRRAAREWNNAPADLREREAAIAPLYEELLDRLDQLLTPHQRRLAGGADRSKAP